MRKVLLIITTLCLFVLQNVNGQSTTENKEVILRYFEEIVNNRKLDLVHEVFAEKFIRHDFLDSSTKTKTTAEQERDLANLIKAFPDLYYVIGHMIAEGDKVFVQAVLHGTHKGTIIGVEPSGNRVDYLSEIFVFRLQNGKIVERWVQIDMYNLLKKLKGEK